MTLCLLIPGPGFEVLQISLGRGGGSGRIIWKHRVSHVWWGDCASSSSSGCSEVLVSSGFLIHGNLYI